MVKRSPKKATRGQLMKAVEALTESLASASLPKKEKKITRKSNESLDAGSDTDYILSHTRGFTTFSNTFSILPRHMTLSATSNTISHNNSYNSSKRFQDIIRKSFDNDFYIKSDATSRIQLAVIGNTASHNNNDVMVQTKQGFLLKSNTKLSSSIPSKTFKKRLI